MDLLLHWTTAYEMWKKLKTVMNRLKLKKLNTVMNRLKLKKLNT